MLWDGDGTTESVRGVFGGGRSACAYEGYSGRPERDAEVYRRAVRFAATRASPPPLPGGADVFPRRWWIVPSAGDVLISVGGFAMGVASVRTDSVDPPRGRGVMKLPGLLGGGGDTGSWFRGVAPSAEGEGRGGRGGDEP